MAGGASSVPSAEQRGLPRRGWRGAPQGLAPRAEPARSCSTSRCSRPPRKSRRREASNTCHRQRRHRRIWSPRRTHSHRKLAYAPGLSRTHPYHQLRALLHEEPARLQHLVRAQPLLRVATHHSVPARGNAGFLQCACARYPSPACHRRNYRRIDHECARTFGAASRAGRPTTPSLSCSSRSGSSAAAVPPHCSTHRFARYAWQDGVPVAASRRGTTPRAAALSIWHRVIQMPAERLHHGVGSLSWPECAHGLRICGTRRRLHATRWQRPTNAVAR